MNVIIDPVTGIGSVAISKVTDSATAGEDIVNALNSFGSITVIDGGKSKERIN